MDRGFLDFARLYTLNVFKAYFVIRARSNLRFRRIYSHPVDQATGLRYDQTIALTGINSSRYYPENLRRVRIFDAVRQKHLTFLSNNFILPPEIIAELYKCRWKIELFFRWIKQHLRIKSFYGTSENAVKTQIWIAISVYVHVAIIKKRLNLGMVGAQGMSLAAFSVFRPGNSAPQSHNLSLVRKIHGYLLQHLPRVQLLLRSDAAGYNHRLMRYCDQKGVGFVIAGRESEAIFQITQGIKH